MKKIRKRKKRLIYTPAQIDFCRRNIKGKSREEMRRLFNKRFKMKLTYSQMIGLLKNNKLTSGLKRGNPAGWNKKYFDKHINYLRKIVPDTDYKIVCEMFNKKFGFNCTVKLLRSLCKRYKIQNGFTGYFPKGHIPHNKGKKGYYFPGSEKGWFKKGHKPANWRPIESERIVKDYVFVKVTDKKNKYTVYNWKAKQVVIWEKEHGPVPKGFMVIFLDGNNRNFNLDNLQMISRSAHAVMCHMKLYSNNKKKTKDAIAYATLMVALSKKKQSTFKGIKKSKMIFIDKTEKKVYVTSEKISGKTRYFAARETKNGLKPVLRQKTYPTFQKAQAFLYEYAQKRKWRVL